MTNRSNFLRLLTVAGVLIFIAIEPSFTPSQVAYATPTVTVTSPSGTVQKGEDLDYATHDWHDAWDMNQESDIYFYVSPTCNGAAASYSSISFAGNMFSANQNGQPASPWLWLIHPGYPGALHVGKDGNVHKIDATKYTQLTFRMWMNAEPSNGTHLIWTDTDTGGLSQSAHYGLTEYFRGHAGWAIYTIDLTQVGLIPGQGTLAWGGNITGLGFFTGDTNVTSVKIDWVRLTPKSNRTVSWTGTWGANATAQLYYSTDNFSTVNDPLYIFSTNGPGFTMEPDTISAGTSGGTKTYNVPASFPSGTENIRVKITDGSGPTTSNNSAAWQFIALPDLTFVAPSYTSGDDFATKVVGNPWDMSDSADVASTLNTTTPSGFSSGVMTATSINGPGNCSPPWGDPEVYLNMGGHSIDTSYYRYATVKMKINSTFDFGNGWVARWFWDNNSGSGYGDDMPLYQNPVTQSYWNIFSVDMWQDIRETDGTGGTLVWSGNAPTRFRLDPHEIPPNTQFDVDYVFLTANHNALHNGVFAIKYLLNQNYNATFFYSAANDNTCNSTTRRSATPNGPVSPPGAFKIFFPLVFNNSSGQGDPPGTRTFLWNLNGIASNYYYVCADVYDTFNTVKWVSDTPIFIKP